MARSSSRNFTELLIALQLLLNSKFKARDQHLKSADWVIHTMSEAPLSRSDDVDHLLRNAQLRDELEPFLDDSISQLNVGELPTRVENEYLASMLAWETCRCCPLASGSSRSSQLPRPETLTDEQLHDILWDTIQRLYDKRIVLDFTDHLSDRQLYCLIFRDILPSPEKKLERSDNYLHWDCADAGGDPEVWLRYYASDEDRRGWKKPVPVRCHRLRRRRTRVSFRVGRCSLALASSGVFVAVSIPIPGATAGVPSSAGSTEHCEPLPPALAHRTSTKLEPVTALFRLALSRPMARRMIRPAAGRLHIIPIEQVRLRLALGKQLRLIEIMGRIGIAARAELQQRPAGDLVAELEHAQVRQPHHAVVLLDRLTNGIWIVGV